jgi:hypothetical protein
MFTDSVAEFFGEEFSHEFQQSLRAQENYMERSLPTAAMHMILASGR